MSLLTNALLLSPAGWLDLGVGPLTVSAHGPEWANVLLVLSDTQPPATLTDGEPLRGTRFFGGTTHVWGLSLGQSARVVVTAPDVGASVGSATGGGSASGGAATIADGADTALGSTSDATWGGAGSASLVAVAKAIWTKLGSIALGAAIPAGEAHIGEIGGNVGRFVSQFGPSSSTTYAAGQAMSGPIEVTGMGRVANGSGLIVGASLELAVLNTVEVDLVMFSSQPAGGYTAGAAFAVTPADRNKISKVFKLTDWTALGTGDSLGEVVPAAKFFSCEDTTKTTSLWTVPIARGSITLASATDATLKFRASRN